MANIPVTLNDKPDLPSMRFSEKGCAVSRGTCEMVDALDDAQRKKAVLFYGIDEIMKSDKTTDDEKALATFATQINAQYVGLDNAISSQELVLKVIAESMSGPLGAAIAKVTLDSEGALQDSTQKSNMIWYGLNALKSSPALTGPGKALAELALKIDAKYVDAPDAIHAKECVLKSIASSQTGPVSEVLAKVSLESVQGAGSANSKNNLLWYGLSSILADTGLGDDEKALANLATGINSNHVNVEFIASTREAVLHSLEAPLKSPVVNEIARLTLDSCKGVSDSNSLRNLQWYGLKAILDNPKTGAEEKTLAQFANSFDSRYVNTEYITRAREIALKELVAPLKKPYAELLPGLCLQMVDGVTDENSANNLLWYGLKALNESPRTDPLRKPLMELGLNVNPSHVTREPMVRLRKAIMEKVNAAETASTATMLAGVALDVVKPSAGSPNDGINILWYTFDAINKSPLANSKEKSLAKKGLQVGSGSPDAGARLKAQQAVMEEILNLVDPREELTQMAENLAKGEPQGDVIVEDDMVRIGGVKLERKTEAPAAQKQTA